jgi:fructuronate reductase
MKTNLKKTGYDRKKLTTGILHIGVGNFHRAHEQYYTNLLMEKDPSQTAWGIAGAMLMPQDEDLYQALKSQDGIYTLTVCGRDGNDEAMEIGTLVELLRPTDNPVVLSGKIARPEIKIISMTITEGGYNIPRETGEFNLEEKNVAHDLKNPHNPTTVFGHIAEGLRKRRESGAGPVTILSCDNLQHNGDTTGKAFMSFFRAQDPELAEWAEQNVTFPNSMVDRITPSTTPADVLRLNSLNSTDDKAPVYCEDFIQWVVEDNFAAGRPAWEKAGVQFTDDVTDYENMKLSLLNASHTLLSYPSFLSGYRKVDDAMHDPVIAKYVKDFMDKDVTPYVPAPEGIDLDNYKQTLIERFGNRSVSDQIARLCFDGLSKFPVYVTPNLSKMVADGKDLTRLAYLIAAYRHYLKYQTDDNGASFQTAEPWLSDADKKLIDSDNPLDFLSLDAFAGAGLAASDDFKAPYLRFADDILKNGAMSTLKTIV